MKIWLYDYKSKFRFINYYKAFVEPIFASNWLLIWYLRIIYLF